MRGFLVIAMLTISVCACAPARQPPPQMVWYKAGASNAEFEKDRYGCMRESARMFPATAGVQGIADPNGGVMSSYDINEGNRNDAAAACIRTKGWHLVPQIAQSYAPAAPTSSPTTTDPVLTCQGNVSWTSPTDVPQKINGGVLRIKVGREVIIVTTAEGAAIAYRVEGTSDGWRGASARNPDGSLYHVQVSAAESSFVMMHIVNGEPKEGLSGPCT